MPETETFLPAGAGETSDTLPAGARGAAGARSLSAPLPAGAQTPSAAAPADADALPIGAKEVAEAGALLRRWRDAKRPLEQRLADDELWFTLRHWETLRRDEKRRGKYDRPEPSSAWLFNTLLNKHADVMDNLPEPLVLPREPGDAESARTLSKVLPVVLENCGFADTYARQGWEKLKHGTAVYGVFWNPEKDNGLGDVEVRGIDLLNVFWEPGVEDVQRSKALFLTELADTAALEARYPQYAGRLGGGASETPRYYHDAQIDLTDKSVVVDWYYKRRVDGRTVLHYAKFVGDCLLYASENDPAWASRGFYDHGLYPVVFDPLFPEKGTPAGFGYIAVTKDPQTYIDLLSANLLESAMMSTRKRFFVSTATNVDPAQFADWDRRIVPVEGELSDARIQEIRVDPVSGVYMDLLRQKIQEMKDTAGNRDVNAGGVGSGVTAAAAIAALQEAGNKTSRDLIAASFRAHERVCALVIELMRQFYTEARAFRVTGASGAWEFAQFDNRALTDVPVPGVYGEPLYRRPVFDLKLRAQKRNPFSLAEGNERAKEFFALGFFDPRRAPEALGALEMMEFEGKDAVEAYIRERAAGGGA